MTNICSQYNLFNNKNMSNRKIKDYGVIIGYESKIKKSSIRRCGVIPYVIIKNVIYFCFGIDNRTKDITDFAGGRKFNETFSESARREFEEESLGVFDEYKCDYENKTKFKYKTNYTIFVKFYIHDFNEMNNIQNEFNERLSNVKSSETCGIIWVSQHDILNKIYNNDFYSLTKSTLLNILDENVNFFNTYLNKK